MVAVGLSVVASGAVDTKRQSVQACVRSADRTCDLYCGDGFDAMPPALVLGHACVVVRALSFLVGHVRVSGAYCRVDLARGRGGGASD